MFGLTADAADDVNPLALAYLIAEDSQLPEPSDDEGAEDARDAQERDESTANEVDRNRKRLAHLQRPLAEIRVALIAANEVVPESQASKLIEDDGDLFIPSGGVPIPMPDRYTTCQSHRPLYFEELNLERCGNTYGCATNLVSGIYFLTNTTMLPYRLATQPADCPVATHGDCPTCHAYDHDIEPFGCEPRGVLAEAAAAAGFVFLML